MRYSILGPLEVWHEDELQPLGGRRQETILATLLLEADHVVPISRLIESVWDTASPTTARAQVQNCTSEVRRRLARLAPSRRLIETRSSGYVVYIDDDEFDYYVLRQHVGEARAATGASRYAEAARRLRAALDLWRAPTLDGISSRVVRGMAAQLDEQRWALHDECVDIELRLGRHSDLIAELSALVAEYPTRQSLVSKLMVALYRAGRTAEALSVYRQTRSTFIEELGLEPGEGLRRLERAILCGDPALDLHESIEVSPREPPSVPQMLPPSAGPVVGRDREIAVLRSELAIDARGGRRGSPPVCVLTGPGGAGKTALAVAVAHESRPAFADGVLYVDLQASRQPVEPYEVLGRFLRALGVAVPVSFVERVEVYRSQVNARTMLLLLDDAPADSAVSPLLPGSGSCATLVTARSRLAGLGGTLRLELDVLDYEAAVALLMELAGRRRVAEDPAATVAVLDLCECLPLAVYVCGVRLADKPHWSMARLFSKLADPAHRLDTLSWGTIGVRETIGSAYHALDNGAQWMFRRLSFLRASAVAPRDAATLGDVPTAHAEILLDQLVDARLLKPVFGPGGSLVYALGSLAGLFGREQAARAGAEGRAAAAVGGCPR